MRRLAVGDEDAEVGASWETFVFTRYLGVIYSKKRPFSGAIMGNVCRTRVNGWARALEPNKKVENSGSCVHVSKDTPGFSQDRH